MKKTIIILTIHVLLIAGCNQTVKINTGYENIPAVSIQTINETCLIVIYPDINPAEYSFSEEELESFDDLLFYASRTESRFTYFSINAVSIEKRYLSFALDNGKNYIIDTNKQNQFEAFLYKNGQIPLPVNVVSTDWKTIADYLQMDESKITKRIESYEKFEEQPKASTDKEVKYYYSFYSEDFGGDVVYVFYDDETLFECFACKLDTGSDRMRTNRTYTELNNSLLVEERSDKSEYSLDLINADGRIPENWKMINYQKVISPYQIVDFSPDNGRIPYENIQRIKGNTLIFPNYEEKFWSKKKEKTRDEWTHYKAQKIERLHELNFKKYRTAEKRYLSFTLADGKKIIVDMNEFGEERFWEAILYIEGHIPFRLHLMDFEDKRENEIETALRP
jgi:hypothetical protein